MGGEKAILCHADPPYGMGKENEGVANDNLYRDKLDTFQMSWWRSVRPFLEDNASAYIWGNAEDLWRLWYFGGMKDSERLTFRNQIIWDKPPSGLGDGQNNSIMRSYGVKYEACLFFMLGEQGFNNNADNYWEGFESIRAYLDGERKRSGWTNKTVAGFFGFHPRMADHWFSKSQWSFPTEEQYRRLQTEANSDAFKLEYDDLKREYDDLKREYDELKREFYATRAYFDNTHDNMTDVWDFHRVSGDERHGHATPKPVEMVARAIKSSSPEEAVVVAPFSGTGPEMVAAQNLNRKCYGVEISPGYCAVILQRMFDAFGIKGVRVD
jgi:DNA modification methylase